MPTLIRHTIFEYLRNFRRHVPSLWEMPLHKEHGKYGGGAPKHAETVNRHMAKHLPLQCIEANEIAAEKLSVDTVD